MIWYDRGITDVEQLGKTSRAAKAAGIFPWTGNFAPTNSAQTEAKFISGTKMSEKGPRKQKALALVVRASWGYTPDQGYDGRITVST